ncbi:MAG: alternative ribosome rescue aminoacyl-tRNA hydrolase ArfB [Bdellovibrio sp.]
MKVPEEELTYFVSRSSGAGGQNVNKVNSKVTLRWHLESSSIPEPIKRRFTEKYENKINDRGEVVISSQEERTQKANQELCLKKLQDMLKSVARAPKKRIKTKPHEGAVLERLGAKKRHSEKKRMRNFKDY